MGSSAILVVARVHVGLATPAPVAAGIWFGLGCMSTGGTVRFTVFLFHVLLGAPMSESLGRASLLLVLYLFDLILVIVRPWWLGLPTDFAAASGCFHVWWGNSFVGVGGKHLRLPLLIPLRRSASILAYLQTRLILTLMSNS